MEPASPTATKYSNCLSVKRSAMGSYDARLGAAIKSRAHASALMTAVPSKALRRVIAHAAAATLDYASSVSRFAASW